MSIRALKKWALLLTFWVALQTRCLRADQTVTGNLTVTGAADVQGNTLGIGTYSTYPGLQIGYTDGTTSQIEFDATRAANIWKWQLNGSATLQMQMSLDNNNALVLYDQSSTPAAKITLDPLGTSTFENSVTINGTDNQMPNQTLTGSGSVLTEGLADGRYASSSIITIGSVTYGSGTAPTTSINGGTASGAYSFAEGPSSSASGYYSTAIGYESVAGGIAGSTAIGYGSNATGILSTAIGYGTNASGWHAVAIGNSTASGYASMAIGYGNIASDNYSTASGYNSTASGYASTVMGFHAIASGDFSTASGFYTTAQAYNSFVVGTYNVGGGSTTSWEAGDPLFEIGNGGGSLWAGNLTATGPSDALVVYKNGNEAVQGSVTVGGEITAGGVITAQPGGDIPMYSGE